MADRLLFPDRLVLILGKNQEVLGVAPREVPAARQKLARPTHLKDRTPSLPRPPRAA